MGNKTGRHTGSAGSRAFGGQKKTVYHNGHEYTVCELAKLTGLSGTTIQNRIRKGYTFAGITREPSEKQDTKSCKGCKYWKRIDGASHERACNRALDTGKCRVKMVDGVPTWPSKAECYVQATK